MESNDPLKKLFRQSAMERAPENLIPNVMKAIEASTSASVAPKPLISGKGWVVIATSLLLICLYAIFPFGGDFAAPDSLIPAQWIPTLQISLPELPEISPTAWTAAFAFGVFGLLHLYWLNRQLGKQGVL